MTTDAHTIVVTDANQRMALDDAVIRRVIHSI
jgi:hypothetical protein